VPDIPIVLVTGSAEEAIGLEAVREGIQDYLQKITWGGQAGRNSAT
jgi:CheY-like chemotaxis protein